MTNRAYRILNSHTAERNRLSFILLDRTACFARSTSSLADLPKFVVAPAGCAPRSDVSPSGDRAVLRVKFPTAPLASMIKFPVAVDGQALDSMS